MNRQNPSHGNEDDGGLHSHEEMDRFLAMHYPPPHALVGKFNSLEKAHFVLERMMERLARRFCIATLVASPRTGLLTELDLAITRFAARRQRGVKEINSIAYTGDW